MLREFHDRRKAVGRELDRVLADVFVDDTGEHYHDEKARNRITKVTKTGMEVIGHPAYSFATLWRRCGSKLGILARNFLAQSWTRHCPFLGVQLSGPPVL